MTFDETRKLLDTLGGAFGPYDDKALPIWHKVLEPYPAKRCSEAMWKLIETAGSKPRVAHILEAMALNKAGGGSEERTSTDCPWCHGGGWAQVEKEYGKVVMMRCMCQRGSELNKGIAQLTDEIRRTRRLDIFGRFMLPDPNRQKEDAECASRSVHEQSEYVKQLTKQWST